MHEFQEARQSQPTTVIKEDLYAPVAGIVLGGVITAVSLAGTFNRVRKGEGLKARDAVGAVGGFVTLSSLAKANQYALLMMYQETTQEYIQN